MALLLQIETVMKSSLRTVMGEAVESYSHIPRIAWVLDWPGQVVLATNMIYWTSEVTEVNTVVSISYKYFVVAFTKLVGCDFIADLVM